MTLIATVAPDDAGEPLRSLYARVAGPGGAVDNILLAHGLRPHTLEAHMALYKAVLHHRGNTLPKYFLESIGVLVSGINGCDYCIDHHLAGLKRLLARDSSRFARIAHALAQCPAPPKAVKGRGSGKDKKLPKKEASKAT